jgi:TonB family protein
MRYILLLIISINIYANIEIKQNLKALYKNVKLTEKQKNYIFDNEEIYKRLLSQELKKTLNYKNNINGKNVVRFSINKDGTVNDFEFLQKSGNEQLDRNSKKAILRATKKFPRPKEKTEMRYILIYDLKNTKKYIPKTTKKKIAKVCTPKEKEKCPGGCKKQKKYPIKLIDISQNKQEKKQYYKKRTNEEWMAIINNKSKKYKGIEQ